MGSIAVQSDAGGHHLFNSMFGGANTHHATQDSPAAQHTPVRASPHVDAASSLRVAPPPDVPMGHSSAPPPGAVPSHSGHLPQASASTPARVLPPSPPCTQSQPHPSSAANVEAMPAGQTRPRQLSSAAVSPAGTARSADPPAAAAPPRRIKVKSLEHIRSFADDAYMRSRRQRRDGGDVETQYEISDMPVSDIIEMVAGILTKITTTNDQQHKHLHRHINPSEGGSGISPQTTSVLAFHGKNVPSISILSYLSRIHKYCPTTYEVFLSLLVYFDRMTERVNAGTIQSLRHATQQSSEHRGEDGPPRPVAPSFASQTERHPAQTSTLAAQAATPPPSGSLGKPVGSDTQGSQPTPPAQHIEPPMDVDPLSLSQFFVVDSYNIHRLVIAGVTCASKFFSDVFYTNSRYAKVGGLPLNELNHLELQFLILNDFRLAVPLEEMEAYGTMLVEFYAREVAERNGRSLDDQSRPSSTAAAQ